MPLNASYAPPSATHAPERKAGTSSRQPRGERSREVRHRRSARRQLGLFVALIAATFGTVVTAHRERPEADSYPSPRASVLAGMNLRQRVVTIADSQVGYHTEPATSYCNKYSAYWHAGQSDCPTGARDEEWCADFAAWAWQQAGIHFTYGYSPRDINAAAISFYDWAIANRTWHPVSSGYIAKPGDVAIYGLILGTDPSAVHVAVVTQDRPGQPGPNVVNGDGDRTAFSAVETGTDQLRAHLGTVIAPLAGYASPT